jgi:hypothetical protein
MGLLTIYSESRRWLLLAYNKKINAFALRRTALVLICILLMAVISFGGYMLYQNALSKEAANISGDTGQKFNSNTMKIVRAKNSMKQGELLDASKVELVEVPVELAPQGAVASLSKLYGRRLKREIAEKEFLNEMDLMHEAAEYEEGDRLIEHKFAEGAVPAAVSEGSSIDIKLFVKDDEDCVVVSKAVVVSRNANLLSFYLNDKEQEFLKEAATEGMLFAVQYLDTSQQASQVTYVPLYDKGRK